MSDKKVVPEVGESLAAHDSETALTRAKLLKIMNYGPAGSGKTNALGSLCLVPSINNIMVQAVENNSLGSVIDGMKRFNCTEEQMAKMHISRVAPSKTDISTLISGAKDNLLKSQKALDDAPDLNKRKYTRYMDTLRGMQDFVDIHGVSHGSIDTWGSDTVLAIDSLTILAEAIQANIIGGKAKLSLPARGSVQSMIVQYIRYLTEQLDCHVILLGHPKRYISEVTGLESIYPVSNGTALNDLLPTMFTDVIYSSVVQGKWLWSSKHSSAIVAARNIVSGDKLPQDYTQFSWV